MVRIGVVDVSPNDHHDRDLQPYLDGVRMAGGEPFVMAWTTDEELLSQYVRQGDGFLLSGGGDIHQRHRAGSPDFYKSVRKARLI